LKFLFPTEPAARRRLARGLALLALALAIFLIARAVRKEGGVIELNRAFGARFQAGLDPWWDVERGRRVHGPYPPSLAWIAVPLSWPPLLLARGLWAALQIGALAAMFGMLARRARESFPTVAPHCAVLFAASLLLVSRFLLRDFAGGGGNLIYATLALGGLELALCNRALVSGIPLGLSLALKPNLAPFVLFLLLRRRFQAAASALGFALLFFWLPALSFGPARYAELASEWAGGVVQYAALEDLHESALVPEGLPRAENGMNQSLREALQRLLRPPGDSGAVDVHVIETSAANAAWIARGLSLLLLGFVAWTALRARGARAEWLALLAFFPLSLLLSPITWKSHHVSLLALFFGLCCAGLERARSARGLWIFLALYWFACNLLSEDVAGREAKRVLQAVSIVTWFDILLIAALAKLVWRESRSTERESVSP
jgi:hypothetical protein